MPHKSWVLIFTASLIAVSAVLVRQAHSEDSGRSVGYAVLTAEEGSRIPVAAALFSLKQKGVLASEAGVGAVVPVRRGRIFFEGGGGIATGLAFANPSDQALEVSLTLRDASGGQPVCTETVVVEAEGHLAKNVGDSGFFEACPPLPAIGSVTFETRQDDPGVAAITIRTARNNVGAPLFATFPVAPLEDAASASPEGGAASMVFPQIGAGADSPGGTGFTTQIVLINAGSESVSGEIRLFGDDGGELELELSAEGEIAAATGSPGLASRFRYELPGQGVLRGTLSRSGGLISGYAVITRDSGRLPAGTAVFQIRDATGNLISEAGVAAAPAARRARLYVDSQTMEGGRDAVDTGVAVAVPGAQDPVSLTLRLRDRYGETLAQISSSSDDFPDLRAGGHTAAFVRHLFPKIPKQFRGLMEIESASEFHAVTLKQTGLILTTLPLADLGRPLQAESVVLPQLGFGIMDGLEFSTRIILIDQDVSNDPLAPGSSGEIRFRRSVCPGVRGTPLDVPLFGGTDSRFVYHVHPGGGNRLRPGDRAKVAQIRLPTAQGGEFPVAVDGHASVRPEVMDSESELRDDFQFTFNSLDPAVASIDALGRIRAHQEGFSTLTVGVGSKIATATITVTRTGRGLPIEDVRGVVQDTAGRVYLASPERNSIWRAEAPGLTPQRFAGTEARGFIDNVTRDAAEFDTPDFVALENLGGSALLYASDSGNNRIRRIEADPRNNPFLGLVTSLEESFETPEGIALDNLGQLWVAERGARRVRRVDLTSGRVDTIAGRADTVGGCEDGPADQARFQEPVGLAVVPRTSGQQLLGGSALGIVVADRGCGSLRLIACEAPACADPTLNQGWRVETIAEIGGPARQFRVPAGPAFDRPEGVAVDPVGNIFFSLPESGRVRVLLRTREVVEATQSGILRQPRGLSVNQFGRLLVGDSGALTQISYAPPEISGVRVFDAQGDPVSPPRVSPDGGDRIILTGRNFAPDSVVVIGNIVYTEFPELDSATIEFISPPLLTGLTTVSVLHRGGLDQTRLSVREITLDELAPGSIATLAGGGTFAGDGASATEAGLRNPTATAIDANGNLLIADERNHRIRRVDVYTGTITTVAGTGEPGRAEDGQLAVASKLNFPQGVAVDRAGNIFIADSGNNQVHRVDAVTGKLITIAGDGEAGFSGDNGPARQAELRYPTRVALDEAGNVYIGDSLNHRIRRVLAGAPEDAPIQTLAGNGSPEFCGDGGAPDAACLNYPTDLAVDTVGGNLHVYVADTENHRIRRISISGDGGQRVIETIAGDGVKRFSGDGGPATNASLDSPQGIGVDARGDLFIADTNNARIRLVRNGVISSVADIGPQRNGQPAIQASLADPHGLTVDGIGNLFIADTANNRILKLELVERRIENVAGADLDNLLGDGGPATDGTLHLPSGLAVGERGLFISDTGNSRIRRVLDGVIASYAGTTQGCTESLVEIPADMARLQTPMGLALYKDSLYVADTFCRSVRKIDLNSGRLTTVAGNGAEGCSGDGGEARQAQLGEPVGVALDGDGNLYIADQANHNVRMVSSDGTISTVAGRCLEKGFAGDHGAARDALLNSPAGVAVDHSGKIYIGDTGNQVVRVVERGVITTFAGRPGICRFSQDQAHPVEDAILCVPSGVAIDSRGRVYILDGGNGRIRRVEGETISTVAGRDPSVVVAEPRQEGGRAIDTLFVFLRGMALDEADNLYVIDFERVRVARAPP